MRSSVLQAAVISLPAWLGLGVFWARKGRADRGFE